MAVRVRHGTFWQVRALRGSHGATGQVKAGHGRAVKAILVRLRRGQAWRVGAVEAGSVTGRQARIEAGQS